MMVQIGNRGLFVPRRLQRLLLPPSAADDWEVVDARLLADLFTFLPRLPPGQRLRSLDFSRLPELKTLPAGIHCDQVNLSGTALRSLPKDLHVTELLDLHDCKRLTRLPTGLRVQRIDLRGCQALCVLPHSLRVGHLDLRGCSALSALPSRLSCLDLDLEGTHLRSLPTDIRVKNRLNLRDCRELQELPPNLRLQILVLRGCTGLRTLPVGLEVFDLDIQGCTNLTDWPEPSLVHHGRLLAADCTRLRGLPRQLTDLELLDVRDCTSLRELPAGLRVRAWVEVANTALTGVPQSLRGTTLRLAGSRD